MGRKQATLSWWEARALGLHLSHPEVPPWEPGESGQVQLAAPHPLGISRETFAARASPGL